MIYEKKIETITLKVKESAAEEEKISYAEDIYNIAKSIYAGLDDDQEHFLVFFLDQQNKIRGFKTLFSGGQAHTNVDIKIIFRNALIFGAVSIVCIHNHPSGGTKPSIEDIRVTKAIKEAGELLEIKLLDHIIIGKDSFHSFLNNGLL